MLRPERMSKVSVTGSQAVLPDVIEAVHDLDVLHVSDYDESWEGFQNGSPLSGAESASDKLVTARSLKSILGITEDDAGPARIVTDEALAEELEEIRVQVNELDDRRSELRDERRAVGERLDSAEPFVTLGIDLDLLGGYDNLAVAVGEGDHEAVRRALVDADAVQKFEIMVEEDVVAVFAYPAGEDDVLDDALVGVEFTRFAVPETDRRPEEYVSELEHERQKLDSKLKSVESELENLRLEYAGFLLAAEEKLAIEVQKTEAPLQFATTEHAFVAEGWVPTDEYADFAEGLKSVVGDHVEIEELERAEYEPDHYGHVETEAVADGGHVTVADNPPVVQDNPDPAKPFELLVETINLPKYSEFDPTVILFLTFPAFFGFMIGDLGYGLLYMGMGYWLTTRYDSDAIRSLGGMALWAGGFTALFGVLYGEIFGLHVLGDVVWGGHPPMHKGLQPAFLAYAQAWLIISLFVALLHLTTGYALDFTKNLSHGLRDAVTESASWILLMWGVWVWIFSRHAISGKPEFLFAVFNRPGAILPGAEAALAAEDVAFSLGFGGLPATVGLAGLVIAAVGFALLLAGEGGVGALESLNVLVNVLSYTRIAAVLLAKAGMAFVVNLLFFGAYSHDGEFHFLIGETPAHVIEEFGAEAIMFPGLVHSGIGGVAGGLVILVVGHLLVLALGITSAGLQAVRLEYVEFFGKFYDGGGEKYEPFGYQRTYTTED